MRNVCQYLETVLDKRKSFGNKAMVLKFDDGSKVLQSYTTEVARVANGQAKVYGAFSNTTLRHIKDFLYQEGFGVNTKEEIQSKFM